MFYSYLSIPFHFKRTPFFLKVLSEIKLRVNVFLDEYRGPGIVLPHCRVMSWGLPESGPSCTCKYQLHIPTKVLWRWASGEAAGV